MGVFDSKSCADGGVESYHVYGQLADDYSAVHCTSAISENAAAIRRAGFRGSNFCYDFQPNNQAYL